MNIYTDEVKFCVKYLKDKGVVATNYDELCNLVDDLDLEFDLVRVFHNKFDLLAEKLRELWPSGEKDGKYPWRDSVNNLSKRLQIMWSDRFPKKELKVDECVEVAKRYLAKFDTDTRYMKTLKYFILKKKQVVSKKGEIKLVAESTFADMLEGKADEDAVQNEWDALINSGSLGEGELI